MVKKRVLILLLFAMFIGCLYVKADSGWDVDYDSGSSWDSGDSWSSSDSWGSSDSWSSDSSWSSDRSYSGGKNNPKAMLMVFMVTFLILIYVMPSLKRKTDDLYQPNKKTNYNERILTQTDINAIDASINIEKLKSQVFEIYENIQNAWMNFDFETIKKYATDELFNAYKTQLNILSIENQKNIMKNIELMNVDIIKFEVNNNIEEACAKLCITMYDYVIDKDNKVIRGSDKRKLEVEYLITLIRHVDIIPDKCPKCGADITNIDSGQCEYCRAFIVNDSSEFKMSKKEKINQRSI